MTGPQDTPRGVVTVPVEQWERLRRLAAQLSASTNMISHVNAGLHEVIAEVEAQ